QRSRAPIQKLADKIASIFVPAVIGLAVLTFLVWFFIAPQFMTLPVAAFPFSLNLMIAVLIIACPCALGLATPTAIMVGTGKGAENGILIKNGEALEIAQKIDTIIFDKTGTLTKGTPEVTEVIELGLKKKEILFYAGIAEKGSEHPLADAILNASGKVPSATSFKAEVGKGVVASFRRKKILVGTRDLMRIHKIKNASIEKKLQELELQGKTVVIVAVDKKIAGLIAIADRLKENSREALDKLGKMGVTTYMITGDNERTAKAIARQAGITNVIAGVLPGGKSDKIKELQSQGKVVAMVGDGINDAPALAQANLGIALGSGTDVAIETGQIVLIKNDLRDVVKAIQLSRYTLGKIKQNLFLAFAYNVAAIPIAAGILYPFTGFLLNPMIAAAAMGMSSVSVVSNAALMRLYKPQA
ncbi:MAG: heavy metal translocating P-type ATPase, partial [Nanoarchaeota archaeon]